MLGGRVFSNYTETFWCIFLTYKIPQLGNFSLGFCLFVCFLIYTEDVGLLYETYVEQWVK